MHGRWPCMDGYVISLTHPLTFLIWQLAHPQAALNPAWAGLLVVGTYMPLDNDGERSCGHDVKGVGEADSQGQALSLLSQRLQQLQLQRAAYAPSSVHPTSLLAQAMRIRALCVCPLGPRRAALLMMRTTRTHT